MDVEFSVLLPRKFYRTQLGPPVKGVGAGVGQIYRRQIKIRRQIKVPSGATGSGGHF